VPTGKGSVYVFWSKGHKYRRVAGNSQIRKAAENNRLGVVQEISCGLRNQRAVAGTNTHFSLSCSSSLPEIQCSANPDTATALCR